MKTQVSPGTRVRNLIFGGFQKLIICSATVLAVSNAQAAREFWIDGGTTNWPSADHTRFTIDGDTTVNITNGVIITMVVDSVYPENLIGDGTGSAYLNLSGNGSIDFAQQMTLELADSITAPGKQRVLNMSGTSHVNPAQFLVGFRGDCVANITDSAMIDVRTDGEAPYTPIIELGNRNYGPSYTATINQSGNSTIQSLASGMKMGGKNTAIYNMSGGKLILGGTIEGPGADDRFNFTGGTIILKGGDYRNITDPTNAVWFSGGRAAFDGTDTTILPLDPLVTAQPQSVGTAPGTTATMSVTATGTGILSYQWQQNGTNRVGQTKATLSLPNVALTDAGSWRCVVTGPLGTNTSKAVTLTVAQVGQVALNLYPGLNVTGTVGLKYRVEYANALTPNTWLTLTNLNPLSASPFFVLDPTPGTLASRFYRTVLLP